MPEHVHWHVTVLFQFPQRHKRPGEQTQEADSPKRLLQLLKKGPSAQASHLQGTVRVIFRQRPDGHSPDGLHCVYLAWERPRDCGLERGHIA